MGRILITVLSSVLLAVAQEPAPREAAPPSDQALAPEEAAASFELHPDFEIALVAAEPLIALPVGLDWDARGRIWALLAPSQPEETALESLPGALAILTDADGDGRMDERADFALGLRATSFVFHRDGVIVSQADEIAWLRDRDSDDRSDETSVLYAGCALGNLRWGLDGWVYGTKGASDAKHVTGKSGRDFGPIGSGVIRFRPDGSALELVAASSAGLAGFDSTWDGELFFSPLEGSHLRHVVLPEGVLASGRVDGATSAADAADHDTASVGGSFYTGGAWPAEYDGDHFSCLPDAHAVHHDRLTPRGITFSATRTREAEFLVSRDPGFRPVQTRVGPDGALYVLDSGERDARAPVPGREHGRIWRIQQHAVRAQVLPRLPDASETELVAALGQPGRWTRATAQRLLLERELSPDALGALAHEALNAYRPQTRVHALWLLALEDPQRLTRSAEHLLRDPEASVRRNALAALGTLDPWHVARVAARAMALIGDPDARTRLAALVALRDLLASERESELLARYPALEDDWQRSAFLAVAAQEPASFVEASLAQPANERVVELVAALASDVGRRGALKDAVEIVRVLGDVKSRSPAVAEAALSALDRTLDPDLVPWASMPLDKALLHLVENESVEVAIAALPLAERWSKDGKVSTAARALGRRLGGIAVDAGQGLEPRLRSLAAMLALPEERAAAIEIAASLLDASTPLESQVELIEALARTGDPAAARALCGAWARLWPPADERTFRHLLERASWTAELLDALEAGTIEPAELGLEQRHRLLEHPDGALATRAQALFGAQPAPGATPAARDVDAVIAELLPLVESGGDRVRGRAVFLENCASCHALRGVVESPRAGPDLTGKGALGATYLLPFLVDPEREIDPAYLEFVAETKDGRLVDGVIARESDEAVVLRNSGGETELRRSELVELRPTGRSPMPSGFETLGAEALRDLFAFLAGG